MGFYVKFRELFDGPYETENLAEVRQWFIGTILCPDSPQDVEIITMNSHEPRDSLIRYASNFCESQITSICSLPSINPTIDDCVRRIHVFQTYQAFLKTLWKDTTPTARARQCMSIQYSLNFV